MQSTQTLGRVDDLHVPSTHSVHLESEAVVHVTGDTQRKTGVHDLHVAGETLVSRK